MTRVMPMSIVWLFAVVTALVAAQPVEAPSTDPGVAEGATFAGVPELESRLLALHPDDPMSYFRLAEEVGYESPDARGTRLAQRLYVLAFEADRRLDRPLGIGASVCIGLADLSREPDERRWLLALAAVLGDDADRGVDWDPEVDGVTRAETAPLLAQALDLFRAHEYRDARRLLARDDVGALLDQFGHVIEHGYAVRDVVAGDPVCFECRNQRIVKGGPETTNGYRLCYNCGGNPGPELSDENFLAHIRLESVLLDADHTSWSAQVIVDNGEPLRDLEPNELAAFFDVDPDAFFWSPDPAVTPDGGRWVAAAGADDDVEP